MNTLSRKLLKILSLAAVLVLMLTLCGCRTRVTNNDVVSNVMYDEEGYMQEEYEMRRDELGLSKARAPLFKGLGSTADEEYEYDEDYDMLDEYDPDDYEDDFYDDSDPEEKPKTSPGNAGTNLSSPGTSTTTSGVIVTLDPNGGTCTIKALRLQPGSKYGNLPVPIREGYTFEGWFDKKDGGTAIKVDTEIKNKANHTLYAHWKKGTSDNSETTDTYTVTFDPNGGTCEVETLKVKIGEKYGELPTPEREGYKFTGWYTKKDGGKHVTADTKFNASKNHKLYAHWEKESSTDENQGSNSGDNNGGNQGGNSGDNNGGNTGDNNGNQGDNSGDNNGGNQGGNSGDNNGGNNNGNQGGNTGDNTGDNNNGNQGGNTTPENPTPTPEAKKHTVSFDANGGDAVTTTIEVTEGGTYGTLPTPNRTGYTFAGWFTETTGGTRISSGDPVSITADQTLHAQWEEAPYTTWTNKFDVAVNDASERTYYMSSDDDRKQDLVKACKGKLVDADKSPEFVIKFINDWTDESAAEEAAKLKSSYPDSTAVVVDSDAVKGGDNSKLVYKMLLLNALNSDVFFTDGDLDQAADELGVASHKPYTLDVLAEEEP